MGNGTFNGTTLAFPTNCRISVCRTWRTHPLETSSCLAALSASFEQSFVPCLLSTHSVTVSMFTKVVAGILCAVVLLSNAPAQAGSSPIAHAPPPPVHAATVTSSSVVTPASTSSFPTVAATNGTGAGSGSPTISPAASSAPDVYLNVPTLSVAKIELDVDNLQADINLNANVASLVTINAGVAVSIQKVNITIANVDAELELVVRLGNLVNVVNRVFQSLDLNPLLINTLNNVTSLATGVVSTVVGAVDGLLGTITQGGTTLSFVVDNLGNIVQEVNGGATTIVGNYLTNMTYTGASETLAGGLIQKTYSYSPLNSLVNIVFNTAGQVVQATVAKATGSSSSTPTSSSPVSSSTAK